MVVMGPDLCNRIGPLAVRGSTGLPFCVTRIAPWSASFAALSRILGISARQSSISRLRATSEGQRVLPGPRACVSSRILVSIGSILLSFAPNNPAQEQLPGAGRQEPRIPDAPDGADRYRVPPHP